MAQPTAIWNEKKKKFEKRKKKKTSARLSLWLFFGGLGFLTCMS